MADRSSPSSTPNMNTKPLPPGMVLGPDGKPCKVCTAFRNWKPRTGSNANDKSNQKQKQGVAGAAAMAALASGAGNAFQANADNITLPAHCPPDVEQIGRSTWTFLHTTAAYYPDKPSLHQRANMLNLLHALPVLYPCSWCAMHLGKEMQVHPPDVSSRLGLSRWLCERHNDVNVRLGKEKFDCNKTDERWKDGPSDGSCD